jgi:hypothetical protein
MRQAAAAALLRRLYHPRLSAFQDGILGSAKLALMVMIVFLSSFRRMLCGLFRNTPDPRALHRLVNRLQRRGGGVRRVRPDGTVLLSHRGGDDHVPRRAQNPRDGVRAIALTGLSAELLIVVFLKIRCRSRKFDLAGFAW